MIGRKRKNSDDGELCCELIVIIKLLLEFTVATFWRKQNVHAVKECKKVFIKLQFITNVTSFLVSFKHVHCFSVTDCFQYM